ncbi:uncharacterized protein LOC143997903 [Lithobates pipiens]
MAAEGERGGGAEDSRRSTDDGETPTDMEEERETLRRQIQQLQGLISQHKNKHGNAPAPAAPAHPRWRDPLQLQYRPRGSYRVGAPITGYQPRQPHPHSTWRAQYSLVNRTSRGAEHSAPVPRGLSPSVPALSLPRGVSPSVPALSLPRGVSPSVPALSLPRGASPSVHALSLPRGASPSVPALSLPRGASPSVPALSLPRGVSPSVPALSLPRGVSPSVPALSLPCGVSPSVPALSLPRGVSPSVPALSLPCGLSPSVPPVVVPSASPASLPNKGKVPQKVPAHNNTAKSEPAGRQKVTGNPTVINNNNNKTLAVPKAKCLPSVSALKPLSDEAAVPSTSAEGGVRLRKIPQGAPGGPCRTSAQVPRTSQNLSNATQGSVGTLPPSNRLPAPHLKPAVTSPPPNAVTTAKNRPVAPNPSLNTPKATLPAVPPTRALRSSRTKYTWVAESPKTNPSAKKVSPGAKRASAGSEKAKSPASGNGSKAKKSATHQKCTPKNRYKWKAQPSATAAATSSAPATPSQTAITRSAQRTQTPETARPPHGVGGSAAAPYRDSGNSSYKVKSRTKIVRRRSTSRYTGGLTCA